MATQSWTHIGHRLVYKDTFRWGRGGLKEWFSWQTPAADPSYIKFMDDFFKPTDISTSDWTITQSTSASVATETTANSLGGVLAALTGSTGTDTTLVQLKQDIAQLTIGDPDSSSYNPNAGPLGKRMWFETAISATAPTTSDVWVGIQALNPSTPLTVANGIGFRVTTGSANIYYQVYKAGTGTSTQAFQDGTAQALPTPVAGAFTKLGFYFDGNTVQFFVNRLYVGSVNVNLPTVVMSPTLYVGDNAAAAQTLLCDYIDLTIER